MRVGRIPFLIGQLRERRCRARDLHSAAASSHCAGCLRFAREHLIAIGSLKDKGRHNCGHLPKVAVLHAIPQIHIAMMGPRVVLERVLNELESRQADGIVREVIGAASIGDGNRVHAHGLEGLHPFLEDRPGRFVPLQINAAEFAAAVVNVEVNGKFILSGLLEFPRAGFGVATAEVVCHVSAGTKQALLPHPSTIRCGLCGASSLR